MFVVCYVFTVLRSMFVALGSLVFVTRRLAARFSGQAIDRWYTYMRWIKEIDMRWIYKAIDRCYIRANLF